MKQYTDAIQTMRLKDLGFPAPKGVSKLSLDWDMDTVPTFDYSIGELLSFIPDEIESEEDDFVATFQMTAGWEIYYTTYSDIFYYFNNVELVDALFDMVIELKENRII